jgi:hypothetical protein
MFNLNDMRRRKNHNASTPHERIDPKEEKNVSKSKRPEGSVNEHRQRVNRNHNVKDGIKTGPKQP